MWDQQFEDVLRKFLPFLGPAEKLEEDTALRDFGLDSLGTVELLAVLEGTYDVRFLDDALDMANFATPGVLWNTLSKMAQPAG